MELNTFQRPTLPPSSAAPEDTFASEEASRSDCWKALFIYMKKVQSNRRVLLNISYYRYPTLVPPRCFIGKQFRYMRIQAQGVQEVEVPRYRDNQKKKVVRLSALCTGRFYPY